MSTGLAGKSVVWMPLAGTVVWGLGVATLLILLVMPPLYAGLEDIRSLFMRREPERYLRVAPEVEREERHIRKVV